MSRYLRAEIIENSPLNKNHNLLILSAKDVSDDFVPGQFYMIGTNNSYDPLLKRPFSIFKQTSGELHFLYRIKGKGTEKMSKMKKGTAVNLLGPLGNGYSLPGKNRIPLLIAGGIGIASLFSLAGKLQGKCHLFYGGRTKDELLMLNELKGVVKELIISTDDGSMGEKGTVVDTLNVFLTSQLSAISSQLIYACGPAPMLKAVSKIAIEKGINGYISMEENMACGVGACLGCAVKTRGQGSRLILPRRTRLWRGRVAEETGVKGQELKSIYKRVCKEGPVFSVGEIVW